MKRLVFALGLFVSLALCLSVTQASVVEDGLFAYWSFDETAVAGDVIQDVAGGNDATMNGGAQIVAGKAGDAIEFDGIDGHLDLGNLIGFAPEMKAFSLELWLKTEITADWTTLFKVLNDGCTTGLGIDLNRTAKPSWLYLEGNTHFYMRDENCLALAPEIQAEIYDSEWHHIVWVVDDSSNNVCAVYVDGVAQTLDMGYETSPDGFADFMYPVYLGAGNNRGNIERFCPATVDEFRLYTKALSGDEVIQNMQSATEPSAVSRMNKLSALWSEIKK